MTAYQNMIALAEKVEAGQETKPEDFYGMGPEMKVNGKNIKTKDIPIEQLPAALRESAASIMEAQGVHK